MNSYKNYVDLLRNILKNFDDEFDNVIKKILSKIFDEYHMNRNNKIYCLDNLYKKYNMSRYNHIKKKYGVVKNIKLIFRFNRYSKKSCIIKLLKDDFYVILDENETYDKVADNILQISNIKNYKKYINNTNLEKYLSRLDCTDDEVEVEEEDFQIKIIKRTCNFPPCLNQIIGSDNYCNLHNKDMI